MKKLILLLFTVGLNVQGQSHRLTRLENIPILLHTILRDYLTECYTQHFFYEDKGILHVVVYKDSLGRDNYQVSAIIDDRYLDKPTSKYFIIGAEVFLFYDGDSNGNIINETINTRQLKALKDIVQDRVYIRPKKKERWVEIVDMYGKIKKVRAIKTNNFTNSVRYIFLENGTFEKLKGV